MDRTFDVMRRYPEGLFLLQHTRMSKRPYNGEFWFRLGNHCWVRGMLEKAS